MLCVQSLSVSDSLWPHGMQHTRLFCPSLSRWICSNSCPLNWWCYLSNSSCQPLLLPSIFPRIRVFSDESVLCIRWPKYWSFSFNISSSNDYSVIWFPLALTGLISLQSEGLIGVIFSTTIRKRQFFGTQTSLWYNSHLYMTGGKTIALTLCTSVGKIMSLLFSMLSRFVIAFFNSFIQFQGWSRHLQWLWSLRK